MNEYPLCREVSGYAFPNQSIANQSKSMERKRNKKRVREESEKIEKITTREIKKI